MGARWRTARAVVLAAALAAGARAGASVQVEPIARLTLEGGYDSNVLYDGRGNEAGRVSPGIGLHLRDHTWNLLLDAGGDLLMYPRAGALTSSTVWNQRLKAVAAARLTERTTLDLDAKGTYAFDQIGIAREGIFRPDESEALLVRTKGRLAWRYDHLWTVAGTFDERVARFSDGTGAASHTPGVEVALRLDHRSEVGGTYRLDVFQIFGPASGLTYAHEALGIYRYRLTRRLTFEATAGPVVWSTGGTTWVIPQAGAQVFGDWRRGAFRLSVGHGVGLGVTATPGLFDSVEGGATMRLGTSWEVHADGGLWRSGAPPWGSNSVLGYGVEGELAYRITRELKVGAAVSRFARADLTTTRFDRDIVGLRMSWELRHR
jgi:hypothetical protein